ncbi:MAG: hypothetical protein JWO38_3250 [Gemmataceae bacterium]|nr:hypothetical protein [Gemmataceae bacterium]
MRTTARPLAMPAAAVLGWLFSFASPVFGQNNLATEEGMFVPVRTPITSEVVSGITSQVTPRLNSPVRPVKTIVFDFNPGGKDVTNADYGACWGLAKLISGLRASTTTVAFVHGKAGGHTVLPILACKELVMSKGASLGEVVSDTVPAPDDSQKVAYEQFTPHRKSRWAAVRKMFDKDVVLGVGVLADGSVWYVDVRNPPRDPKVNGIREEPFAPPGGQVALYTTAQARKLELCQGVAETRADVAELYNLSPSSTQDDILNGRSPEAYRYTLTGEVDGAMRESVNRIVRDIKGKRGNVLILTLNCAGGDLKAARDLADDLRAAQTGDDPILVIGYIPDQAPDSATFLAFGCTDVVMSKRRDVQDADRPDEHREAELGDFQGAIKASRGEGTTDAHRKSLKDLAEQRSFPGILVDGMFDKDLEIVWVKGTKERNQRRLMSAANYEAEKTNWVVVKTVKSKGQLLKLGATLAEELGIARYTVETRDPALVYALYGLEPAKVKEVTPGWLDRFAEFLRLPAVTVLLVVIGFTGLILELKVPGLTVPGIVAALCFILVFWSQSRFSGEMFVLALLLFVLGLILVALEIFVLPGFGAPGVCGILCMLAGLGLVTFERVPQTGQEWGLLGVKVSQYLFGLIGSFGLAFLIARFLPKVPYANRLMLAPPPDRGGGADTDLPGAGEAAELLGAIGTANTTLRPAGVVRFGDKFVDVVSDGGFVPAGTRVQVIAVEGTRIVVKEV